MNLLYSIDGEQQCLDLEGDDLKEIVEQVIAHFQEHHPDVAADPDFPVKVVYTVDDAYAQDMPEAVLQL